MKSTAATAKSALREKLANMYNKKFTVGDTRYRLGETAAAYTLLLPTIVSLIVLFVLPLLMIIFLSFQDFRMNKGTMEFCGLENYKFLFTDKKFGRALLNTVFFAAVKLGADVILALVVAFLLDSNVRFRKAMRMIYFSPVVVPVVACSLIWLWFYDPSVGPLNQILTWLGLSPSKWLYGEDTALISIIIFSIWHGLGYNVVLLLSGLQGISGEYLEAAKLDGASNWQIIKKIKLPLLKPIINFVIMMGIINAFKAFSEVDVMTPPSIPGEWTHMVVNYIHEAAFGKGRMGRGAAASIILFFLILVLTQIKNRIGSKSIDE